jgi:hypothetical protein
MSRFEGTLRGLSDRLSLPQRVRARVLLEVAGDLEALYEELLGRGLSEAEAARRSMEQVDLSEEALRGLVRVHGGWFRRLTDRVGERAGRRWESAFLGALILFAVGASGAVLRAFPMARAAGLSLIPVALATAVTLGIGVWKAYLVWVRRDHRLRGLHRGLGAMLGAVVLQLFLSFGAVWVTGWRTARAVRLTPDLAGAMTFDWLFSALALLVMALGLTLVSGLLWFLILGRVASIERADAAVLLPEGLR